jgi:uncharacterized protein (TIGR00297 family)
MRSAGGLSPSGSMNVWVNAAKSRPSKHHLQDGLAVLGCWLVLGLFPLLTPPSYWLRLDEALLFTTLFAAAAWMMRAVSFSGALAGFALSVVLYVAEGPMMFAALVAMFLLTWGATRFRRARKPQESVAEAGGRTASQVAANVGPAALVAVVPGLGLGSLSPLVALAVLAEIAADTVSSEYGQAISDEAYLVTTGERVPAGTQGAVSSEGTKAGVVAAIVVYATWQIADRLYSPPDVVSAPTFGVLLVLAGAIVGMKLDSLLGATLERKGVIGNNIVNLAGTTSSAVTVFGAYALLGGVVGRF